ncbi:hypothetical protein EV11_1395 [Prochlorococcus sp. SS52]|nr:hypothetical protein EV04_1116 [Prochlorococcus marinus str. LG]KGG18457.1 hypothetical protein EV08_1702 [Prochlorococcus marinus str. SS2]KGG22730.1 hypothetical protein EV09_1469 [Prochlorococcus marinus str. SS35]KGG32606.1 hypothetical protein EV10_0922 [Prochlorococcus marinus str. SS51]KGG35445.1 hypothetical protein EV11_1395 [Prochlorococcus sp. SS52]
MVRNSFNWENIYQEGILVLSCAMLSDDFTFSSIMKIQKEKYE